MKFQLWTYQTFWHMICLNKAHWLCWSLKSCLVLTNQLVDLHLREIFPEIYTQQVFKCSTFNTKDISAQAAIWTLYPMHRFCAGHPLRTSLSWHSHPWSPPRLQLNNFPESITSANPSSLMASTAFYELLSLPWWINIFWHTAYSPKFTRTTSITSTLV